jgi:hypothetical protein
VNRSWKIYENRAAMKNGQAGTEDKTQELRLVPQGKEEHEEVKP